MLRWLIRDGRSDGLVHASQRMLRRLIRLKRYVFPVDDSAGSLVADFVSAYDIGIGDWLIRGSLIRWGL